MKIGILAQYIETRPDVKDLIIALSETNSITLFISEDNIKKIEILFPNNIIIKPIPSFTGYQKALKVVWQYIYLAFGSIPRSTYNYYMVETIRLSNPSIKPWSRRLQKFLVAINKITNGIINYDTYLKGIKIIKKYKWEDTNFDTFLCFTQIYDDWFYAQILSINKPIWTYVYSWDHPCKLKTFSKKSKFLVWNQGLKNDLIELQSIDPSRITELGATQFTYLYDYLKKMDSTTYRSPYSFPYLYLGFATGYEKLARLEIKYAIQIAQHLRIHFPDLKLVIRPYPFFVYQDLYDLLKLEPNVIFDSITPTDKIDKLNFDKFSKISHAIAFLHFGTTMGYEASYFNTPSILLDFVNRDCDRLLNGFIHQYQNDKYLNLTGFENVPKSIDDLIKYLHKIVDSNISVSNYNQAVSNPTPLQSKKDIIEKFINIISK